MRLFINFVVSSLTPLLLSCSSQAPSPPAAPAPPPPAAPAPTAREPYAAPRVGSPVVLPAEFIANRIFVKPVTRDGLPLRLFTDSGGGTQFLYEDAVSRLGWPVRTIPGSEEPLRITPIPEWRADAFIPPPLAIHQPPALQSSYLVLERKSKIKDVTGADEHGFLGQGWFGGRVWTFDYPTKRLFWRAEGDLPPHAPEDVIPLHLPLAEDGLPAVHFGRIAIRVDGETIDLLFDTGATLSLTPEAVAALGDGSPSVRGTSFITKSVFDRWRARHPDWRVLEKAEQTTGWPIIEVPRISIAGHEVGPVWFTYRPDRNFHEFMSSMMDARVEGALGGSALQYLRVSVDYPRRLAVFQEFR